MSQASMLEQKRDRRGEKSEIDTLNFHNKATMNLSRNTSAARKISSLFNVKSSLSFYVSLSSDVNFHVGNANTKAVKKRNEF